METMEDFLIACKNFLLFSYMDGPSRDIDNLKGFIEPFFLFSLWTQTLDSMLLDFEYLSLLFISAILLDALTFSLHCACRIGGFTSLCSIY